MIMHSTKIFLFASLLAFNGVAADVKPSTEPNRAKIDNLAAEIAAELAKTCPPSGAGDAIAYDKCRLSLYQSNNFRSHLAAYITWGRPKKDDPTATLKDTNLTQLAPDVWTSMYLPLFMFNGKYSVEYVEREKLYLIKLGAGFRNRMAPGLFPYPFWHDAVKWTDYEKANTVRLWIHPEKLEVRFGQFTAEGDYDSQLKTTQFETPKFDGKWTWTDNDGKTQPVVTLFDGIFSKNNPYLNEVDASYKQLALKMRDAQCDSCHVPNNPDKMKRLVLLQSPAHAAGEIKRILKSVRDDRMPRDEMGLERALDANQKEALLKHGAAFDAAIDNAKAWEKTAKR